MTRKRLGPIPGWLGRRLRQLRLERGLTQVELAGRDYSPGFISLVETGRSRISPRTARVLATRLRVPVTALTVVTRRRVSARQALSRAWDLCDEMETYARDRRAVIEAAIRALPAPGGTSAVVPPSPGRLRPRAPRPTA